MPQDQDPDTLMSEAFNQRHYDFQQLNSSRGFEDYYRALKTYGLDIRDMLLDRAITQEVVNFMDFGCGRGMASLDFFPVLAQRAEERGIPPDILHRVGFIGIDRYVINQAKPDDSRVSLDSQVDITLPSYELPIIDVCVSHWVFPYVDKKLEAMAKIYSALSQGGAHPGEIFITALMKDQVRLIPPGMSAHNLRFQYTGLPVLPMADAVDGDISLLDQRDALIHVTKGDLSFRQLAYVTAVFEPFEFGRNGLRGKRPVQRVSIYREAA